MREARLEEIRLRNFKSFRDVTFRKLGGITVLVGENGVGKSTFFDVFGFIKDCLANNVRQALAIRGGFREVVTRGHGAEAICFELKFRMPLAIGIRTVTYLLEIAEIDNKPVVRKEILQYTRFGGGGKPYKFLDFEMGSGNAIVNEQELSKAGDERRESQKLESPDILAIKGLGQFQRFEAASKFRSLIEKWHVSDFHIQSARQSSDAGYSEHLSNSGDNLPLVAQFLFERHPKEFQRVLDAMAARVPGISSVHAGNTEDGRVVLRFQDGSFKDPFISRFVSDGTIKMFAYLVLLYDPAPHPLLCVEEPENQLYPFLLGELAEEFADYAKRGGQVFVSTHSPDLLNAIELDSIYVLEKSGGVTDVSRAGDDPQLKAYVAAGDKPGWLWRQGVFSSAGAR